MAGSQDALETKSIELDLKALTEEGEFEGLASTFGNVDEGGDMIRPGAFKASIKNAKRIRLLWSHDMREVIGIWQSLEETDKGLLAKGQLALGVQRGKEALELMRMGAVDSLSIGFRVPKNGSQFENETRILTKVDLMEISVVAMPMNPKARIQSVKSANGDLGSERVFERWIMRDSEFTRSEAIVIINDGYKALLSMRDAGDESDQVIAALRSARDRASTITKR
jgi:HK97 family phage prohead protease